MSTGSLFGPGRCLHGFLRTGYKDTKEGWGDANLIFHKEVTDREVGLREDIIGGNGYGEEKCAARYFTFFKICCSITA